MMERTQKITTKTLFENISAEKCWAITAKALVRIWVTRERKYILPLLGEGEGIMAPVSAWEKWREMAANKGFGLSYTTLMSWVQETFNISVEDAIGAAKLRIVVATLQSGPELTTEIIEETPEKAVVRTTKCGLWEMYKELELDPEFATCDVAHQTVLEAGLKRVNPKITH
ncbi:MAG: hypothetical protein ACFFCD_15275, partial [Promethearchaeota archaeon]